MVLVAIDVGLLWEKARMYVSIHLCIHYSCVCLLLHLDYEYLKNNG